MTKRVTNIGSCIVDVPGDRKTLCGRKADTVGICAAKWVQAHIDGHNPPWCDACFALWSDSRLPEDDEAGVTQ